MPDCLLSSAAEGKPSLQSACAAFDLHVVTLMEVVALVEPASLRLVQAASLLQQARAACREENEAEAARRSAHSTPRNARRLAEKPCDARNPGARLLRARPDEAIDLAAMDED